MPKWMTDGTSDDELEGLDTETEETETEETEEGEGEDKSKSRKPSTAVQTQAEIKEVRELLGSLYQQVAAGNTTKSQEKKITKTQEALESLLKDGYKPDQLTALVAVTKAVREDIMEEQRVESSATAAKQFETNCWRSLYREIDSLAKDAPGIKWARDTIARKAADLMAKSPKFGDAQNAYRNGQEPSQEDFAKAARLVSETYLKDSGTKSADNKKPPQLDLQSSRSKASPGSSNSKGEIDLSQLSELEREVYVKTKNITKNEEIARKALARVRGR